MNNVDKQYFDLLRHIFKHGVKKTDRTGTGTLSVFDYTMRFDMKDGFPLLTSKKMAWKAMVVELLWFLKGDTNIKYLVDNGCMIWVGDAYKNYLNYHNNHPTIHSNRFNILSRTEFIEKIKTDDKFAKEWGELGPVYGKQWKQWKGYCSGGTVKIESEPVDQIVNLIHDLKNNPDSRRLMVNAWNVADLDKMVLPPCHYGFQCYTRELSLKERAAEYFVRNHGWALIPSHEFYDEHNIPKRALSLKWTQRSVDTFLGLPFNISSYGLLLHLLAKEVNMIPDELIFSGGDVHIYLNHLEPCEKQIKQKVYKLPSVTIADKSIFDVEYSDITLNNYESSPAIKGELSN